MIKRLFSLHRICIVISIIGVIISVTSLYADTTLPREFIEIWTVDDAVRHHSDSLFEDAMTCYNDGDYGDAARLFAECHELDKRTMHANNPRRHYSERWWAECCLRMGDREGYKLHVGDEAQPPVDRRLTLESDSLATLADIIFPSDAAEAMRLFKMVAEIERKALGDEHPYYGNTLNTLAVLFMNLDQCDSAIEPAGKALAIRQKTYGEGSASYISSLVNLAYAMHRSEDIANVEKSLELRSKLVDVYSSSGDQDALSLQYVFMAYAAASVGQGTSDPTKAEHFFKDALTYIGQSGQADKNAGLLRTIYEKLALLYVGRNHDANHPLSVEQQLDNELLALDCYRSGLAFGVDSASVAAGHMRIGQLYFVLGKSDPAIENLIVTVNFQLNNAEQYERYVYVTLSNLGNVYFAAGQYDKAAEALKSSLDYALKYTGEDSSEVFSLKNQLSMLYTSMGRPDIAYQYAKDALEKTGGLFGEESMEYALSLKSISHVAGQLGYGIEAIDYSLQSLGIIKKLTPDDAQVINSLSIDIMERLVNAGDARWEKVYSEWELLPEHKPGDLVSVRLLASKGYLIASRYDDALSMIESAITGYKTAGINEMSLWSNLVAQKSRLLSKMYRYEEAIELASQIIDSDTIDANNKISAYGARAEANVGLGLYDNAIADTRCRMDIRNKGLGDSLNVFNLDDLDNLANYYLISEDYEKTDSLRRLQLNLVKDNFGPDSYQYLSRMVMVEATPGYGNPYRMRDLQYKLLDFVKRSYGENSLAHATEMMNTAEIIQNTGDISDAVSLAEEATSLMCAIQGESYASYLGSLVTLGSLYMNNREYEKAREVSEKCIRLSEKYHPGASLRIYNAMKNILNSYSEAFDYGSALYEAAKMEAFARERLGEKSSQHLEMIVVLVTLNYALGDFATACQIGMDALDMIKDSDAYDRKVLRQKLGNIMAMAAYADGEIDVAVKLIEMLVADCGQLSPENRLIVLHNASVLYHFAGENEKAIAVSDRVLSDHYMELLRPVSKSDIFSKEGYIRTLAGDDGYGLELMKRGLALRDSIYEGKGRNVLLGLKDMITVCSHSGDRSSLNDYALRYSAVAREYVRSSFLTLPAKSRQALWDQFSDFLMCDFQSYAIASDNREMDAVAYDNLLLGKGLMLNTQREIADLVADSDNQQLQSLYQDFIRNHNLLNHLSSVETENAEIDSLKKIVAAQEFEVLRLCGDFMQSLSAKWEDVKAALGKEDAAVEFATFSDTDGKRRYVAAVVTPYTDNPRLISLPEADLTTLWNESPDRLSSVIWKPLSEVLANSRNVFFSAAGELYTIPVETLADWEDRNMFVCDRWSLNRLSSTRELISKNKGGRLDRAVVYGGLKYDTEPKVMEAESRRYAGVADNSRRALDLTGLFSGADSMLRSGASYLPQTLVEANGIYHSLEHNNIKATLFTDTNGTETSFKALSGKNCNLIHIATHGFSWSESDTRNLSHIGFLNFDGNDNMMIEDKALSRCGLLFAGANNVFKGETLPDDIDDGVLLAREIADLDFRDLDLLVLSACETGLGDITGEGVLGLQRGFKKAGAGSILMSLWKVDDKATQMLMEKFYEHLLSGKTKRSSLLLAQKYLREYEENIEDDNEEGMTASQRRRAKLQDGGDEHDAAGAKSYVTIRPYANPRYWAAFILLDAHD